MVKGLSMSNILKFGINQEHWNRIKAIAFLT
jgi:hypothetical protein